MNRLATKDQVSVVMKMSCWPLGQVGGGRSGRPLEEDMFYHNPNELVWGA